MLYYRSVYTSGRYRVRLYELVANPSYRGPTSVYRVRKAHFYWLSVSRVRNLPG